MKIGIVVELKDHEFRVGCTPDGVKQLVNRGHEVFVEIGAGINSNYLDSDYQVNGAVILESAKEVFEKSDMIYKVKELKEEEFGYLHEGQIIFTYIHSNAYKAQTDELLKQNITGIAYEDITDKNGGFPLLKPMSIMAGKTGFIQALHFTQKINGGNGIILSDTPGVRTPEVTIIGAGSAGMGVAELATAFGNKVTILDTNIDRLEEVKTILPPNVELLFSNRQNLEDCLRRSDALFNCILWPKDRTDHLVNKDDLNLMKSNSLIVDISCDEGGAIETCVSTTPTRPIYFKKGIMHYCVDNIPSYYAHTSSQTLTNQTLPFALQIANKGVVKALIENDHLRKGLTCYDGDLTLEETGLKQKRPYKTPEEVLGIK